MVSPERRPKLRAGQDHERPVEETRDNGAGLMSNRRVLQLFRQDRPRLKKNASSTEPRQTQDRCFRESGHSERHRRAAAIGSEGAVALDEERGSHPACTDLAPPR